MSPRVVLLTGIVLLSMASLQARSILRRDRIQDAQGSHPRSTGGPTQERRSTSAPASFAARAGSGPPATIASGDAGTREAAGTGTHGTAPAAGEGESPAYVSEITGTAWVPLGPAPLEDGPDYCRRIWVDSTGRASALAVNPFNPEDLYLGGANGGVWHTEDGGVHWEPISDLEASLAIGALALDNCDAQGCNAIYAGTGENAIRRDTYRGEGLLVLNRLAGDLPSWVLHGRNLFGGGSINNVVLDPRTSGITKRLYVTLSSGVTASASESTVTSPPPASGLGYGIYRSDDDGASWERLPVPAPAESKPTDLEMLPDDPDVLLAGFMDLGIYRTADAGNSWCALNPEPGMPPECPGVSGLPEQGTFDHVEISAVHPAGAAAATLYAVFGHSSDPIGSQNPPGCNHGDGAGQSAVYRSIDGGDTWTLMNAFLPSSYSRYTHALTVREDDPDTVYFGGVGLSVSHDGGLTIRETGCAYHDDVHAIVIPPGDPENVYLATDGGFYVSKDRGATFFPRNDDLQLGGFQSIASAPGTDWLMGGMQDNAFALWKGSRAWSMFPITADGGFVVLDRDADPAGDPAGYFTIPYGLPMGFGQCENGLQSCELDNDIVCSDPRAFYPPLIQDPRGTHRLYYGTNRLYASDNHGDSWQEQSDVLVDPAEWFPAIRNYNVITAIAVSTPPGSDTSRVYVGYYGGQIFRADVEVGGGAPVWTAVGLSPHGLPWSTVSRIAIDPTDPEVAYVTFSDFSGLENLFKTTGGGTRWDALGAGTLPNIPYNTISIEPSAPDHLWLGTDAGVYRSRDAGETWEAFGAGMPSVAVYEFSIDEKLGDGDFGNGRIYAATHGRGAFMLTRQVVEVRRSCKNDQIENMWVTGHAFPFDQNCELQIIRQDGSICSSSFIDAEGFSIVSNASGEIMARRGGGLEQAPFVFACSMGTCLDGLPVGVCNTDNNPIDRVRINCGAFAASAHVPPCQDPAADNLSARMRARDHSDRPSPDRPAAPAAAGRFELVAALHSETGADRSLCTVEVPFQAGDGLPDLMLRGRDALQGDANCLAGGVNASVNGSLPGAYGGEDDWGSPFELSFRAPGLAAAQLVPGVHVGPGAAPDLGFEINELGSSGGRGGTPVRLRFETAPAGAAGGSVQVTETSLSGTCEVTVATSAGETPAQIAAHVASALGVPGSAGPSPGCPGRRRPLDAVLDGVSVRVSVAFGLAVAVDDAGIGYFLGPDSLPGVHPAADAGADVATACTSPYGATVLLVGTGSADPDSTPGTGDDIASYDWFEYFGQPSQRLLGSGESLAVQFPVGSHLVTLRVTDQLGLQDIDTVTIVVQDLATPDADGDGHGDLCDCAPTSPLAWRIPGEVPGLTIASSLSGPDHVAISWGSLAAEAGPGTVYDLLTGSLPSLRSTGGFGSYSCLARDLPGTSADLPQPPPAPPLPGGHWYLIRAGNGCGHGSWGDSGLVPDPRDALETIECLPPAPVLSISKTGSPDPVPAGGDITYTLSYQNTGNADATNVTISDAIPANTAFISAVGGGTPDPSQVVHWSLGTLAAGSSGMVQLVVRVASPLPSGTIISNDSYSIESAEEAPVGGAPVTTTVVSSPVLSISKTDSPDPVPTGGLITYTLNYQNTGNADATNVVVADTVPTNTTFVSAVGGGSPDPNGIVHWNPGTLAAGSSGMVQMTVRVLSGATITNGAYSIDSAETAPVGGVPATTSVLPPPTVAIDLDPSTPTVVNSTRTIPASTSTLDVGVIVSATGTAGLGDIARIAFGVINAFNTGGATVASITPLSIVDLMPPATAPNNATFGALAGEFQFGGALIERGVPGSPYLGPAVQFARFRITFGMRPTGSTVRVFVGDGGPGSLAVRAASGADISGDATADGTPVGGTAGSDQGAGAGIHYLDGAITFGP